MSLHVTEEPRHDGIQTLLSPNKSLARQVLQVQRSVADITSRMELILAQMGLQEKAKGGESGAGHEARERVSLTVQLLTVRPPSGFYTLNVLFQSRTVCFHPDLLQVRNLHRMLWFCWTEEPGSPQSCSPGSDEERPKPVSLPQSAACFDIHICECLCSSPHLLCNSESAGILSKALLVLTEAQTVCGDGLNPDSCRKAENFCRSFCSSWILENASIHQNKSFCPSKPLLVRFNAPNFL